MTTEQGFRGGLAEEKESLTEKELVKRELLTYAADQEARDLIEDLFQNEYIMSGLLETSALCRPAFDTLRHSEVFSLLGWNDADFDHLRLADLTSDAGKAGKIIDGNPKLTKNFRDATLAFFGFKAKIPNPTKLTLRDYFSEILVEAGHVTPEQAIEYMDALKTGDPRVTNTTTFREFVEFHSFYTWEILQHSHLSEDTKIAAALHHRFEGNDPIDKKLVIFSSHPETLASDVEAMTKQNVLSLMVILLDKYDATRTRQKSNEELEFLGLTREKFKIPLTHEQSMRLLNRELTTKYHDRRAPEEKDREITGNELVFQVLNVIAPALATHYE